MSILGSIGSKNGANNATNPKDVRSASFGLSDVRVNVDNVTKMSTLLLDNIKARFDKEHQGQLVHEEVKKALKNVGDVSRVLPMVANVNNIDSILTNVDALLDLSEITWEHAWEDMTNVGRMIGRIVFQSETTSRNDKFRFLLSILKICMSEGAATEESLGRPIRIICEGYSTAIIEWQKQVDEATAPIEEVNKDNSNATKEESNEK